jgi:hypothetical protein
VISCYINKAEMERSNAPDSMHEEDSVHISISRLWKHSKELYPDLLRTMDWHHLMRCERCVSVLRICYKSQSLDEVRQKLQEDSVVAD